MTSGTISFFKLWNIFISSILNIETEVVNQINCWKNYERKQNVWHNLVCIPSKSCFHAQHELLTAYLMNIYIIVITLYFIQKKVPISDKLLY